MNEIKLLQSNLLNSISFDYKDFTNAHAGTTVQFNHIAFSSLIKKKDLNVDEIKFIACYELSYIQLNHVKRFVVKSIILNLIVKGVFHAIDYSIGEPKCLINNSLLKNIAYYAFHYPVYNPITILIAKMLLSRYISNYIS